MALSSKNSAYTSVPMKEEDDSLESGSAHDTESFLHGGLKESKQNNRIWIFSWLSSVLFIALVAVIIYAFRLRGAIVSDERCARQLALPGPALEAVKYDTYMFRGAQNDINPYKGHPSPELDAAWGELVEVRHVAISPETMVAINKSEVHAVQLPDGNFFGATEMFHQLHCLNLIRQHSYKEYYDVDGRRPPGLTDSPTTLRHHVDHCIDILRQDIMCYGDTSVITHNWVKGFASPYPDFNTKHKCKNFDAIVQWEKKAQIMNPSMPADAVVLTTPP